MPVTLTPSNGALPAVALAVVGLLPSGSPAYLRADAAASYRAALRTGCPYPITSAYRTKAQQKELYAEYLDGGSTAAPPGSSFHGEGTALDLPEPARAWMHAWGRPFGWIAWQVPGEPWHFEYDPDHDHHLEDTMAKLDPDDYTAIADHVWGRIIAASAGIGPGSAEAWLQHAAIQASSAAGAATDAANRSRTARDEVQLHRQAARKGEE